MNGCRQIKTNMQACSQLGLGEHLDTYGMNWQIKHCVSAFELYRFHGKTYNEHTKTLPSGTQRKDPYMLS